MFIHKGGAIPARDFQRPVSWIFALSFPDHHNNDASRHTPPCVPQWLISVSPSRSQIDGRFRCGDVLTAKVCDLKFSHPFNSWYTQEKDPRVHAHTSMGGQGFEPRDIRLLLHPTSLHLLFYARPVPPFFSQISPVSTG